MKHQTHPIKRLLAANPQHHRPTMSTSNYRQYRQIINHHYNIHAMIIKDNSNHTASDAIKIHFMPKTKMAHAIKKHGLPEFIRRRDLGSFCAALNRALDHLETKNAA